MHTTTPMRLVKTVRQRVAREIRILHQLLLEPLHVVLGQFPGGTRGLGRMQRFAATLRAHQALHGPVGYSETFAQRRKAAFPLVVGSYDALAKLDR